MTRNFIITLVLISSSILLSNGCGGGFRPKGTGSSSGSSTAPILHSWNFLVPGDYVYDPLKLQVSGGQARIQLQNYEIDTAGEFNAGVLVGTQYSAGVLTLDTSTANNGLTLTNSPHYSSLVGYWNFEGGFADSSLEGNTAVANGDAVGTTAVFKVGAESVFFDGSGDYLSVSEDNSLDSDLTNQMTVSLWYNFSAAGVDESLVVKGCEDLGVWSNLSYSIMKSSADQIVFGVSNDGITKVNASSSEVLRPGLWYHVLATYDGVNAQVFINKNLRATTAHTGNIFDGTNQLLIGAKTSGATCVSQDQFTFGHIDDVAIWKQAFSHENVDEVYQLQKQRYSGYILSDIIDSGSVLSPWPNLSWVSELPFYKELTGDSDGVGGPNSESSSQYSSVVGSNGSLTDNNNMSQLTLLLKLNSLTGSFTGVANEIADTSGVGNDANASGGTINTTDGVLYQGAYIDGSAIHIDVPGLASPPTFTSDKSISFWLKVDPVQVDTSSTTNTVVIDGDGTRSLKIGVHNQTALVADQGRVFVEVTDGTTTVSLNSLNRIDDGEFHFVSMIIGSGTLRLYVDGSEESNIINSTTGIYSGSYGFKVGDSTNNFSGVIDEVAMWKRALHPSEVLQVYRRGANPIKFFVKSCSDPACKCRAYDVGGSANDCDGDGALNPVDTDDTFFSSWLGVDNTTLSPISELLNNSTIDSSGQATGNVLQLLPDLDFSNFSAAGLNVAMNRYFQFKTVLESIDRKDVCSGSTCLPTLTSVGIGSNNFFGGPIEVYASNFYTYGSSISDIQFDTVGGVNCSFSYQLSNDGGVSWYYYDTGSSSWIFSPTISSSESFIRSGIETFHTVPGGKDFTFRAFIESTDTISDCRLNDVTVSFIN